jgi:soluble lytic murein transglycosylase
VSGRSTGIAARQTGGAAPAARRAAVREAGRRRRRRKRRGLALLGVAALVGLAAWVVWPAVDHAVHQIELPLHHADIIRQQARAKHLDPALIAAVIYAESKFRQQTSAAGAVGLMQLLPGTAEAIARRSGATRFNLSDLGTPQVNISYGSYYLRLLIDHYGGSVPLAIAAYNAGEANVDRWVAAARRDGRSPSEAAIPFSETRAYVHKVLSAQRQYRAAYPRELGY